MAPLLCLSPTVLDQSFPRDDDELWRVVKTLWRIQESLEEATINLIMTDSLRAIAAPDTVNYDRYHESDVLREVVRLIRLWVLQPHQGIEGIDVSGVEDEDYEQHPAPRGCSGEGLVRFWQDEVGRILFIHDAVSDPGEFFIGVACDSAFAGGPVGEYDNPECRRCFPLVGPSTIEILSEAYVWQVPHDVIRKQVGLDDFLRNCKYIGAVSVSAPSGGSHFKVQFEDGGSWPLDKNWDPIPGSHLGTLSRRTGYPRKVLKDCLINGRRPKKVCRLNDYRA